MATAYTTSRPTFPTRTRKGTQAAGRMVQSGNTHEAIISKEVFEQVQTQIASRRRQQKDATTQIFSGLVKCADCGWSMRFGTNSQNKKPYSHYTCSQYGQGLKQCSAHYIRYDYLYTYVLSRIQDLSGQAQLDEKELLHRLLKASDQELAANAKDRVQSLQEPRSAGRRLTASLRSCMRTGRMAASRSTTSI